MNRLPLPAVAVLLAASALAAPAPAKKKAAALSRTSGRIVKASVKMASGKKGPKVTEGQVTISDDAGHLEDFHVDARTRVTCDGKKAAFEKVAMPGVCDRAARVAYELETKHVRVLELKSAVKADADEAQGRANVTGEVASTDVLAGSISVRLGGGTTLDFKVGPDTKVLAEAEGKPAEAVPFESVKVGDRVEVHSKNMKDADELHVRAPAR